MHHFSFWYGYFLKSSLELFFYILFYDDFKLLDGPEFLNFSQIYFESTFYKHSFAESNLASSNCSLILVVTALSLSNAPIKYPKWHIRLTFASSVCHKDEVTKLSLVLDWLQNAVVFMFWNQLLVNMEITSMMKSLLASKVSFNPKSVP